MSSHRYGVILASIGLGMILMVGCKGKKASGESAGADTPIAQAAQALPEGTNILTALNQKEYDVAVSGLARLQQSVGAGDQAVQLSILKKHVKDTLIEQSASDPKAAEALTALRMLTQGR